MTEIFPLRIRMGIPTPKGWFCCVIKDNQIIYILLNPDGTYLQLLNLNERQTDNITIGVFLDNANKEPRQRVIIGGWNKAKEDEWGRFVMDVRWESEPPKEQPLYNGMLDMNNSRNFPDNFRSNNFIAIPGYKIPKNPYSKKSHFTKDEVRELILVSLSGGSVLMEMPIEVSMALISSDELLILVYGDDGCLIIDNPFM